MKKLFVLLLSALLVMSLMACGGDPETGAAEAGGQKDKDGMALKDGQLLVGYGKVNITPEMNVPLAGYGNTDKRISRGFYDYLYATCFAVTDQDGNTAILFGIDMTGTGVTLYEKARQEISKKYEIPMESIVISASHTHSAPDMGQTAVETIPKWAPQLQALLVKCADMAMADRAPADLYTTMTMTENLNFVRRYKISDGTVCGYISWINLFHYEVVGYESEPDRSLRLLKFDREEKPDIMVANFQTHPHRGGSATNYLMTADIVGAFRDKVEEALGYQVVYFTGAAGNINPSSIIDEDNVTKDFKEQGQALAQYAIDADSTYEKIRGGTVRSTVRNFAAEIDHSEDHLLSVAREANELWNATNDIPTVAKAYIPYGINGPYHAGAIISKAGRGKTEGFDIYAVSFGDVGFAVAPYEMFDTNGTFIKENSPFPVTFVAECANGSNGYFPSELAWDNHGYEVDTCKYKKGTAEDLADNYVEMLTELYNETK